MELFAKITEIRRKAEHSEYMVEEICRDIKKLDYAKRHLTTTITALRRLSMLVNAVGAHELPTAHELSTTYPIATVFITHAMRVVVWLTVAAGVRNRICTQTSCSTRLSVTSTQKQPSFWKLYSSCLPTFKRTATFPRCYCQCMVHAPTLSAL